jgi:hypothetical protein
MGSRVSRMTEPLGSVTRSWLRLLVMGPIKDERLGVYLANDHAVV